MFLMKRDEFVNLHITHPITVGHQESLITYILLNALDAASGHSIVTCINYCYFPWPHIGLVNSHFVLAITVVKGNVRVVQEIVSKPLLDILLFVASADNKLSMTIVGILFHNVPKDRHTAYLNHRLGFELRFLRNASPEASGEKNDFHIVIFIVYLRISSKNARQDIQSSS